MSLSKWSKILRKNAKIGPSITVYTKNSLKSNDFKQTIYNVKLTFTQKQIPRQNEKFNLLSAKKVLV